MAGQYTVFSATSGGNGQELWITDGTEAGTRLLKDIYPGTSSSSPSNFTALGNGKVIFTAGDPTNGVEVWVTDGTVAGTTLVKDINPGTSGANAQAFASIGGGKVLFSASNGANGNELWVSDGTPNGTVMLKDISAGSPSSFPSSFTLAANGKYVFTAQDAINGNELWVTDGTPGGTTLLKDIYPGTTSGAPYGFTALANGNLLFAANNPTYGQELWITDGTPAGTALLKDIIPGSTGSYPNQFYSAPDGRVFFSATDNTNGAELWVSDGTAPGTTLLKDLYPGSGGSNPTAFVSLGNGKTLFQATDAVAGRELWVTDGTSGGTMLLKDINPGGGQALFGQPVVALGNGTAVFQANDTVNGSELWITDGTSSGTKMLVDIVPGAGSSTPTNLQSDGAGGAYFTASDATSSGALWYTDGTAQGTRKVSSVNTSTNSSSPTNLTLVDGGQVLFTATDPTNGFELWITDGTASGTSLVKDINPGSSSSSSVGFTALGNGKTIFQATDGTHGIELWVTNGTADGTSLLKDINPGSGNSLPQSFAALGNGTAVFSADNGTNGPELWVTDGTPGGTSLVKDIAAGSIGSSPSGLTSLGNGKAVFSAGDANAAYGSELWVTDGTAGGTSLVKDINPGVSSSGPMNFTSLGNGKVIFTAVDANDGREAWVTDGTPGGTMLLKDIYAGSSTSTPSGFTSLGNGTAIFAAQDATNGRELWITDGTPTGTVLVKDILAGAGSSGPTNFASLGNGSAVFSAQDTANGRELWVTDGTANGTSLVKNIASGSASSNPINLTSLGNGKVVFSAYDGTTGNELWVTDGTTGGTTLVKDIYPGSAGSGPSAFRSLGNGTALFSAADPVYGNELWITDGTAAGTKLVKDINTQLASSGAFGFTPVTGPGTPATPAAPTLAAASDSGVQGDGITNVTTPTITGSAEAGATVTLYDTDGTTVLGTAIATGGTYSITSTALAEGAHSLTVKATNADTISSAASPGLSLQIDTTAPDAPAVALTNNSGNPNDTLTNDPALTVTKSNAADTLVYSTDNSTYSSTAPSFASDGTYTVYVKEVDAAGNRSTAASLTFTLDKTAPDAPAIALANNSGDPNDTLTNDPTLSVTKTDAADTLVYSLDNSTYSSTAPSLTSDGTYTVYVKEVDAAGNRSTAASLTFTLDKTAPDAPAIALANNSGDPNDTLTNDPTLSVTKTDAADTLVYSLDNSTYSSATPSFTSDGTYTVYVKEVDAAGNGSTASSLTFTLDTTADAGGDLSVSFNAGNAAVAGSVNAAHAAAASFTIAGLDSDATAVVTFNGIGLDGNATSVVSTQSGNGTHTVDLSGFRDGTITASIGASDAAGNIAAGGNATTTLDTTPPETPAVPALSNDTGTAGDNISRDATITYPTPADGETLFYSTDGGNTYTSTVPSFTSDGTYTVSIKLQDTAGNRSTASSLTFTLDTTAPDAPGAPTLSAATDSGISSTDGITRVARPTLTGTAAAGSKVTLYEGSTILGTGNAGANGIYYIVPATALDEGTHALSVTATDAAGNESAASSAATIIIDKTPPATPAAVTLLQSSDTGAADGITANTTPTFTGTLGVAGANQTVTLYDGTTRVVGTTTSGADGSWSIAIGNADSLGEGTHDMRIRVTDVAGNISNYSPLTRVVIDTTAPGAPAAPLLTAASDTGSSSSDGITRNTTPTFTGTAAAGSTVTLYNGTNAIGSAVASSAGAYSVTASPLTDGTYALTVTATDVAGNESAASAPKSITIDTTAPTTPLAPKLTAASDTGTSHTDGLTAATQPTFSGTAEAGATVTLYDDAIKNADGTRKIIGTAVAGTDGYTIASTADLADGVHFLRVRVTDAAGNISAYSVGRRVVIDTQAPDVAIGNAGGPVTRPGQAITGTGEVGARVTLSNNGTEIGSVIVGADGTWSRTIRLGEGDNDVVAKAADKAGNVGTSQTVSFSYIPPGSANSSFAAFAAPAAADTGFAHALFDAAFATGFASAPTPAIADPAATPVAPALLGGATT